MLVRRADDNKAGDRGVVAVVDISAVTAMAVSVVGQNHPKAHEGSQNGCRDAQPLGH